MKDMKSKYAIATYEVCRDYINAQVPPIEIDVFRKLIGCETEERFDKKTGKLVTKALYPNGGDFVKKVLEPVRAEINEKTDIDLEYTLIRTGRKIAKIKLLPRLKDPQVNMFPDSPEAKAILAQLKPEDQQNPRVIKLVHRYLEQSGFDYTMSNALYALRRHRSNFEKYFIDSLDADWAKADRLKEKVSKEKQLKQEAKNRAAAKKAAAVANKATSITQWYVDYHNALERADRVSVEDYLESDEAGRNMIFGPFPVKLQIYYEKIRGVYSPFSINEEESLFPGSP
jgi:hypothetical protein